MKHALSFYIDDDTDIIGFCGAIVVKTDDDKSISCFNLSKEQLDTTNALYVGQDGKGRSIYSEKTSNIMECALEIEREQLNNGGPFIYEERCTCTNCGFSHALFIPRNYCPKCGHKFTEVIYKRDKKNEDENDNRKEDENEQKIEGDARADSTCKGD